MSEDTNLRDRLASMEGRIAAYPAPAIPVRHAHHFKLSVVSAAGLLLVLTATAIGAIAVTRSANGYPGIENPGQPLAGARMECMAPLQAASFLAAHGYTDVVWQIQAGASKNGTTTFTSTPPEHGYVVPAAVLDDGKLHMIVDQRPDAQPWGVCGNMPMP